MPGTDDQLQRQARALGEPTRHRIFGHLMSSGRPAGVAELTELTGLHHNAVRQHLAKLVDAGLVVESTERPTGRGRPRLAYTIAPSIDGRWGPVGPYERLALLLTEVIRTDDAPIEVGRRAGRRERLGSGRGIDPVAELVDSMARHGFDPRSLSTVMRSRSRCRRVRTRALRSPTPTPSASSISVSPTASPTNPAPW